MNLHRFTVAIVLFVACSVVTASALSYFGHGLSRPIALVAFVVGVITAAAFIWTAKPAEAPAPLSSTEWMVIGLFAIVSLRAFLWLAFLDGDHLKVLSPNNLGDLTKHWNYIRYMASGCEFWPDNPLLTGSTIRYPIGMDLFNSLLVVSGVGLLRSLIWTGVIGSLLTGVALYRWGGAFCLAGFLCNGGLAGFAFFTKYEFIDYQSPMAWKNVFLSMMVTQRGFLFCLPAGLLLLDSWKGRWKEGALHLPLWVEVILYSSMPLFHFHTFMFLSMMLGAWFVFGKADIRKYVLKLGIISFVPASVLVLLVTEWFKGPSFFKFQPRWMQGNASFFDFWIGNFGLLIPLTLGLCIWLLISQRKTAATYFVVPASGIFLACCFFLFAPWEWDNTKLMLWSYLTVLPFLWSHAIEKGPFVVRAGVCFPLFFSGFVSLFGGLKDNGYDLAKRSELDALYRPLSAIPISARFAAAPEYNHPLLLMGRKVAMAYDGYLFGHGLPYGQQKSDLDRLMRGEAGWHDSAKTLRVRYLFWGSREIAAYQGSLKPWAEPSLAVASGSWGTLYKLPD